jgi:transitional endoplasmic reticulum ATPase
MSPLCAKEQVVAEQKVQTEMFKTVTIKNEGKQIILPEKMNFVTAITWLKRRMEEDEREINIHEAIDCLPLEGAFYAGRALVNLFGFFDASKYTDPTWVSLEVGPGQTVQVLWGTLQVPGIEGTIQTGLEVANDQVQFCLEGTVKKKNQPLIQELAAEIRRIAREESIYKGKAIQLTFPDISRRGFNPVLFQHKFLDTSKVDPAQLIFPAATQALVEDTLFAPILYTKAVRKAGIPLKRGVLLEGPYGCGKTLTQAVTAKYAAEQGWTYLALEDTDSLAKAMHFAKKYQPAVIAAEDIDRADKNGGRSDAMNVILNTIDGASFKDTEIIVLLTTNHVENITPAMMRPGRLDAVIPVRPPDAAAVGRLIQLYARDLLDPFETFVQVGQVLAGQIPAVVREVVERSKLSAIARQKGKGALQLTESDLLIAANGMMEHLALMREKKVDTRSNREKAAAILGEQIVRAHQGDDVFEDETTLRRFANAE